MGKFYEDLKEGFEEIIAYRKALDTNIFALPESKRLDLSPECMLNNC